MCVIVCVCVKVRGEKESVFVCKRKERKSEIMCVCAYV